MNRVSVWLLAGAAAAAGAWLLALLDFGTPDRAGDPILRLCLLREVLHLPCPGCGMTRAVAALVRGDLPAAVRFHPLAPLLALEGLGLWLYWGVGLGRGRAPVMSVASALPWLAAHGAGLVALWAGRLAAGDLAAMMQP